MLGLVEFNLWPDEENLSEKNWIPFEKNYPRPQLRRETWTNLNGLWSFEICSRWEKWAKKFEREILLPFPVESSLSRIGEPIGPNDSIWYQREIEIERSLTHRTFLHLEKVDFQATIFLNGKRVAEHRGGFDRFSVEISQFLRENQKQKLTIRVIDSTDRSFQPRGKQKLGTKEKNSIFYTASSGIWATVWLEKVPKIFVESIEFRTKIGKRKVFLETKIDFNAAEDEARRENVRWICKVRRPDGFLLFQVDSSRKKIQIEKNKIQVWSPKNPFLYSVEVELFDESVFIERIFSYLAIRDISLCQNPKKICLNGEVLTIFAVLDQGFWPWASFTARSDDDFRFDIEQMKKLGFNALRKHVKVEPSRWYFWCDFLGMLVLQDFPSMSQSANELTFESKVQFEREIRSIISLLRFHPSIVVWVLFNENWGQFDTERLTKLVRKLDPDRLIDSASGWNDEIGVGDIRDVHSYSADISLPEFDDHRRALIIGECGGFGLKSDGWNYRAFPDRHLLTYAFEQIIFQYASRVSAIVFTQLSDVENEKNGILTYDRREIKFFPDHLQRVLNRDFSKVYKLQQIRKFTEKPFQNFEKLHFRDKFSIDFDESNFEFRKLYFYIAFAFCQVEIEIDRSFRLFLEPAEENQEFHYIDLPDSLFQRNKHSIEISLRSKLTSIQKITFANVNRTFFSLTLSMLWK